MLNESVKGKLYLYFNTKLDLKESTNGYLRGDCPYCGGFNTFGINIHRDVCHCFKDCGLPKKPVKLLMFMEGIKTFNELWNFVKAYEDYELSPVITQERLIQKPIEFPEGFRLMSHGRGIISKMARNYIKKRGLNLKRCSNVGIGYVDKEESPYYGYLIFPCYKMGRLVFFQGRKFMGNGPKMMNPNETDFGIGKSSIIYNHDALYLHDKVYLVESIINAETLGDKAIATLGKSVSSYQLSKILESPVQRVVIILDPDAKEEAYNIGNTLKYYKKTKVVSWNGNDDVNDLGRIKTLEYVQKTKYLK